MGTRKRHAKQASMWVATQDLPRSAAHPFYAGLNQILSRHDFDGFVEGLCERFYADEGRPGLPPGRYFRLLLIGYFEGLDAERAMAWRAADSFALREFLGLVLPEAPPDHSTISRTRRLNDLETHEAVFTWMRQRLADAGLVKGKTVGIDATTLEANAALRSIVRRDTGESYQDLLMKLAQASGIEPPTRADLARIDRKRKKKGSNDDVGDKGYHSNQALVDLEAVGVRSYISEPDRGRRNWKKKPGVRAAVYRNRRRIRGPRGLRLLRLRGGRLERPFAHLYETGGMRRVHLRGHTNILKRLLIHTGGFNLGLLMRQLIGVGTPRGLQGRLRAVVAALLTLIGSLSELATRHRRPVWQVSPIDRRSIARVGVVHIGVREMAFTTVC